jgi:DNA-binding NtrC family response regulator
MANILIINADSNLKRLMKLALPGMEHFVRHSETLRTAGAEPASPKLDLVVARLVADDDQGPEDLAELRRTFPTARLIVTAVLHNPALEGKKFQHVVRELQIEYCLLEPVETGTMLQTIQSALALPKRFSPNPEG